MANAPIGNNFIEGPLGVVRVTYDSTSLGKSTDETEIERIEDIKDIFYAQDGTQPADKIPTGQAYQVKMNMAELTWAKLNKVLRGLTIVGNNAKIGRDLYRSGIDNFAKLLKLERVDSDGAAWPNNEFSLTFYKAFPMTEGPIGAFGPDNQRIVSITWYIFFDSDNGCFGYSGNASSLSIDVV